MSRRRLPTGAALALLPACAVLGLLIAPPGAQAAPPAPTAQAAPSAPGEGTEVAEARAQFDEGRRLFHAGKYREAIARFEAAYRIKPHGALHFNVAQCREKLGEWPAALRSYQDYLRELPEARDRAAVRASIGRLEQRLAGAGVQALLVYTDPPGAAVRLDGKARGRTPFLITLPPGAYRLGLTLDGFAPEEREVEVALAVSRLVELVLRPQSGGAAVAPASAPIAVGVTAVAAPGQAMSSGVPVGAAAKAPPAAPDLTPASPASTLLAAPAPPPVEAKAGSPWGARRILAWSAAAVAVAATGVAIASGVQAQGLSDQLRDGTVRSGAEADRLAGDATSSARTANVLYGVGAAAAAAGVTLFVLQGSF